MVSNPESRLLGMEPRYASCAVYRIAVRHFAVATGMVTQVGGPFGVLHLGTLILAFFTILAWLMPGVAKGLKTY